MASVDPDLDNEGVVTVVVVFVVDGDVADIEDEDMEARGLDSIGDAVVFSGLISSGGGCGCVLITIPAFCTRSEGILLFDKADDARFG